MDGEIVMMMYIMSPRVLCEMEAMFVVDTRILSFSHGSPETWWT